MTKTAIFDNSAWRQPHVENRILGFKQVRNFCSENKVIQRI